MEKSGLMDLMQLTKMNNSIVINHSQITGYSAKPGSPDVPGVIVWQCQYLTWRTGKQQALEQSRPALSSDPK